MSTFIFLLGEVEEFLFELFLYLIPALLLERVARLHENDNEGSIELLWFFSLLFLALKETIAFFYSSFVLMLVFVSFVGLGWVVFS